MPKELAALLVEEGAVPADVMERALARHRELGGALDTALLEEGAMSEDALVAHLARAAELPPAPDSAWSGSDARARRVFPSRVAERHGLAPFALDGRELSLVATYPVDVALLDEISFMLSLHLTAHVGPEWRVRELIHRLYGSPLSPRLAAVAAAHRPRASPAPAPAPSSTSEGDRGSPLAAGFGYDGSEPLEPLAAALAQVVENAEAFAFAEVPSTPEEAEEADAAEVEAEAAEEARPPPDRTAPTHWTLEEARAALAAARHRDDVVLVALRYARDFFEFAAVFAVTRDALAGHDALGPEDARERARSVAIWSSDPGIFRTVLETRSPYLGPVAPGAAGTEVVLQGLGRTPRTVLVYPVLVLDRPVCILYADNGEAPVSAHRLRDLLLLLSGVGSSFERIIRARNRRRRVASASPPDAAALAAMGERALDADRAVSDAACAALERHRRLAETRDVAEKLRRALLSGISTRAVRAARALAALRDVDSVPLLIQVLEAGEPEIAHAAADALSAITLQRIGREARRWLGWWKSNRGRGRADWLFSALTSADRETRVAAASELSFAAAPPVPYSADMPAPERDKAARAWAAWWSRSGQVL